MMVERELNDGSNKEKLLSAFIIGIGSIWIISWSIKKLMLSIRSTSIIKC